MAEEEHPPYSQILRSIDADKFAEVLSASSRKARETYFHRHDIRARAAARLPKPGAKNEERTARLYEALKANDDDEMAEEILRTWLLTKRPMLAAALDHLNVPHEAGLTESDEVKKFATLGGRDLRALADKLAALAPKSDIRVYLSFMGAKDVDKVLA